MERETIQIAVFEDGSLTTIIANTEIASPSGPGPWPYSITGVPAGSEYYVEAFMDIDGDVFLDDGEPEDLLDPFPIAAIMDDKDFTLVKPLESSNPVSWILLLLLNE